jgi:hypothetical protein
MGRKRVFESNAERVRAWREKHKEPKYLRLSQSEYSAKLKEFKGICVIQNYDPEKVIEVYPAYKAFFLKHNIKIDKLSDFDYHSEIKRELHQILDSTTEDLGYGMTAFDIYYLLEMPNTSKHYCPECAVRFCLLETVCPSCGAIIKIEEN